MTAMVSARGAATWIVRALMLVALAVIAFCVAVLVVIPRATHGVALDVLTGSMTPGIPVGSVVIDRPVDTGTLRVGDIATYQKSPGKATYITHRIVKIDASKAPAMFFFKGDANRGPDLAPVPATAIRGKVWFHVPYLGALRDTLHTKGGIGGIAMLALMGYAVAMLAGARKERTPSPAAASAVLPAEGEQPTTSVTEPRVMMLATLKTKEFDGLTAQAVNRLLGGLLLESKRHTFTVLVVEDQMPALETFALLESFEPVSVQVALAEHEDGQVVQLELKSAGARELVGADV